MTTATNPNPYPTTGHVMSEVEKLREEVRALHALSEEHAAVTVRVLALLMELRRRPPVPRPLAPGHYEGMDREEIRTEGEIVMGNLVRGYPPAAFRVPPTDPAPALDCGGDLRAEARTPVAANHLPGEC